MTFPRRPSVRLETRDEAYERACFTYLRFVFEGAPPSFIKIAANEVLKYSNIFGQPKCRPTVH